MLLVRLHLLILAAVLETVILVVHQLETMARKLFAGACWVLVAVAGHPSEWPLAHASFICKLSCDILRRSD